MNNPLVEKVETLLNELVIHTAVLVRETYDEEHFGNACAVYKLGNLVLQFSRDRGDDFVDFLNPADTSETCTFDDISLLLGWKSLDEMLAEGKRTSFADPPKGPISMIESLKLIKSHLFLLDRMFSKSELPETLSRIRSTCKLRCKAFFG